ncbi:UTP--glucose-1-phosphate uridylyltransferase GalU [Maricaulaceae bacterium NA33B04]|nr:UTP--glucose-1-phosphate uridylyltransferase GalU [Maricaulaceae bacterium NA33B04]
MVKVRKAVFPVAGLGTRVLPATKVTPKEMLPVFDRPALQYVIDEARSAGIEHFVFVTGRNKSAIEDYFDQAFELEAMLERAGKTETLKELQTYLPVAGACSFVRQQSPLGLGHAVWCARDVIGNEPFAVLLPDMIMVSDPPCMAQLTDAHASTGGNLISVERVPMEDVSKYGVVDVGDFTDAQAPVRGLVEKPKVEDAPSNLVISGRYILEPQIFDLLERQQTGAGGEIQLTDAIATLINARPVHAVEFNGRTYDTGSKLGYLKAFVALALGSETYGTDAARLIKDAARGL